MKTGLEGEWSRNRGLARVRSEGFEEQIDTAVSAGPVGRTTECIKPMVSLMLGGLSKVALVYRTVFYKPFYDNHKTEVTRNLPIHFLNSVS